MAAAVTSLALLWLLSLTTCSGLTAELNNNSTSTYETAEYQPTTQGATVSIVPSDVDESNTFNMRPTVSPKTERPATPTATGSSQLDSSTARTLDLTSSPAVVETSPAGDRTNTAPSTQSHDTGETSQTSTPEGFYSSTQPSSSPEVFSTTTVSTEPTEKNATGTNPFVQQTSERYKTSTATKKATVRQPKEKKPKDSNSGKIVAGLIVGALMLMLVAFLVIYIKKRKLRKQQIITKDWAGVSPFLENEADNGHVNQKISNQISLATFLPQRMSTTLVPEAGEDWEDTKPRMTFGDKYQEDSLDQEAAKNGVKERNGTVGAASEANKGDVSETDEESVSSSQTKELHN